MTTPSRFAHLLLALFVSVVGSTSFAQATKSAPVPSTPEALAKAPRLSPFDIEMNSARSCSRFKAKFKELSPDSDPGGEEIAIYLDPEKIYPGSKNIMLFCSTGGRTSMIFIRLFDTSSPFADLLEAVGEKYPFENIARNKSDTQDIHYFKAKDGYVSVSADPKVREWNLTYTVRTAEDEAEMKKLEAERKSAVKRAL